MANIPKTNCGYFIAPQPSGFFEALEFAIKIDAITANNATKSTIKRCCSKSSVATALPEYVLKI